MCSRTCFYVLWFMASTAYSLLLLAIVVAVQVYFGGPPPTNDYEQGGYAIFISQTISAAASLFSIMTICCCGWTLRPCKCRLGTFIIIGTFLLFAICFAYGIYAAYAFQDIEPTPEKTSKYVKKYYKDHHKPPPFLEFIEKKFKGYCCGGGGLGDYGDFEWDSPSQFMDIPPSCCRPVIKKKSKDGGHCGRRAWKPFLLVGQEAITKTIERLDGGPDVNNKSLDKVFMDQAMKTSTKRFAELSTKLINDASSIDHFKMDRADKFAQIEQEAGVKFPDPRDTAKKLEYIQSRVREESQQFVEEKKKYFENGQAFNEYLICIPYGCFQLLHFAVHGKWKGFAEYEDIRHWYLMALDIVYGLAIAAVVATVVNIVVLLLATVFCPKKQKLGDQDPPPPYLNQNPNQLEQTTEASTQIDPGLLVQKEPPTSPQQESVKK